MNNEMTLQNGFGVSLDKEAQRVANSIGTSLRTGRGIIAKFLCRKERAEHDAFTAISAWYGRILEQTVTVRQAKAMVMAQVAFFCLILPLELGPVYRTAALAWFAYTLSQCRLRMAE
ncbi:MAG: hypothetical protein NC344_03330 [Bacteroidales bacterium]|nr:hypothetical protein [Bacteroidales bacterium]MCM1146863.1 hypothetical protein [Bacteroidales bacterium]MCM1205639.1 hypothetical protein [Bacillota bacterium]MCM1510249.1 hypothetical protein [Clostridium sp.]